MVTEIKDETHWHQLRRQVIGSSEIAALFDASPYMTRFELWHLKKGGLPDDYKDSDRMKWGRLLEPAIIAEAAEQLQVGIVAQGGRFYRSATRPEIGCTPDAVVYCEQRGHGLIEAKNIDGLKYRREWTDDEPPLYYLLQLQHQLACTDFKWGVVAALVGGNELRVFEYPRHEPTINKIKHAAVEFWQSIADGIEPEATAQDYDIVKDLYQPHPEKEIDLRGDNMLPELCIRLHAAKKKRLEAEKEENECKAEIFRRLGDASKAVAAGFIITAKEVVKQMKAKEAHIQQYRQLNVREIEA